jgi:hypothetical protein
MVAGPRSPRSDVRRTGPQPHERTSDSKGTRARFGAKALGRNFRLFDCHGKSTDQLCNHIQLAGIGLGDGARQSLKAFVIAQRRDLIGDDRWRRLAPKHPDHVRHRISSVKLDRRQESRANESIWRLRIWIQSSVADLRFVSRERRVRPANFRSKKRHAWRGFDLRDPPHRTSAAPMSNPNLHEKHMLASGPPIPAFATRPAETGCECGNRTTCFMSLASAHDFPKFREKWALRRTTKFGRWARDRTCPGQPQKPAFFR